MSTMSYCIIENTALDLEEAVEKVREHAEGHKKLSASEHRYLKKLTDAAHDLIALEREHDFDELAP